MSVPKAGIDTKRQPDLNTRLDEAGWALIDTSAITEVELNAVLSRLHLRRVWACAVAERERQQFSSMWQALILAGRPAVPILATVALVLATWWWIGIAKLSPQVTDAHESPWDRVAFDRTSILSDDDVLTLVMNWPVAGRSGLEGPR